MTDQEVDSWIQSGGYLCAICMICHDTRRKSAEMVEGTTVCGDHIVLTPAERSRIDLASLNLTWRMS